MDLRSPLERSAGRFLSSPSGEIRARALAAGVPLPPAGSFRDAVLQETLFRERNKEYAQVAIVVGALETVGHLLVDSIFGIPKEAELHSALHRPLRDSMEKLLRVFEAEVYGDRYLPAYQREQAEAARRERQEALEREARLAAARKRVDAFHKDE